MHTQFDIPTKPMEYFDAGPACSGACAQGRAACPHPMLCRAHLDAAAFADVLAEIEHDTKPATLDDARGAAAGVAVGLRQLVIAVWRAL